MVNVLVTGGNGYFGSLLVGHLVGSAQSIRVLDIDPGGTQPAGVELVVADIRDAATVAAATAGIDVVYHCVAEVPLGGDPAALRSVNVDGTAKLLRACRASGVGKVIHLSSSAVFGVPESNPVLRDTIPQPQEPYGTAKLAAEWACLHAAAGGLDVTIVRPRTIVGHGRLGIFALLFDWIADGADPFLLGDGSNRYQFIHADDLASLCIRAAGRPGPAIYNVGTDRFATMRDAIEHVCAHAGSGARVRSLPLRSATMAMRLTARLGLTPFAPYHWLMYSKSMWFDIEHCRQELDWQPRYSNNEMLAESYDWFIANRGVVAGETWASPHRRAPSSATAVSAEAVVHATMNRRVPTGRAGIVVMAVLAYVPALLSSPGRMPADTKLYLYLNPRRLVSDSIWTFDARQFAGWVPHQMIAYAWPSGPWYVAAEALGLPDWVAHRLWIATIMLAAGTGVAWAVRRLGLSAEAAIAAGLLYQLSPYLVPYVSRTSSMLLPWAGLGWIVGLTIGAATRTRWRDAALCALVIGTVGAVNTTALLLIAPAPVLWLFVAVAERTVSARRAVAAAARIGGLTLATSAWWLAMQVIQGRQGADLLAYSESLEDVSLTATSVEAWRSLGYWLMYIRDPYAPTTTAGADYMTDLSTIVCGFVLVAIALVGLAAVSFPARRWAIALTFTGLVLAVGVHPFGDPSPIARLFRGDGQAGLSLALRSSTRALPLLVLGLALGTGALVDALGRVVAWRRAGLAGAVVVIALGNLPVLVNHGLVDPALERDEQPPAAWVDAAAALDALPSGFRVLHLPGAEFGAFTWGYTVDPPLPALTERPLATRDLLPLGAPAAMDLLYALDDRFQTGSAELATVAPIARLFGADTIWLPGDAAFDRFRTPRPELTAALFAAGGVGLSGPLDFGEPSVNVPLVPMVDEQSIAEPAVGSPVAPVELVSVADPRPIVRASDTVVVLSGSGDGVVDAAAAGLLAGDEAIRYSASLSADELVAALETADLVVVTDSNRRRAHHWRSSQDVTGYTEPITGPQTLWEDSGDARLDVFPAAGPDAYSVSVQDGAVAATATSYGERFSYLPEARPGLAIDGDPNTSWTVLDPAGQFIEITTAAATDHVTLLQPSGLRDVRRLETVSVAVDGGDPIEVVLDDRSLISGQRIEFPATGGPATIRVSLGRIVEGTGHRGHTHPDRTPLGFAEIDPGIGQSPERIVVPSDVTSALRDAGIERPVTYVLTRERVRATNRWRADPEWRIVREIEVPFAQDVNVDTTVRLDLRASDTVLAELLGITGPTATARLTGVPAAGGWAAADGDEDTAWITPFNEVVGAALHVELIDPAAPLTLQQRPGHYSLVTVVRLTQDGEAVDVVVPPANGGGVSAVDVPDGFGAGQVTIEIAAVTERTTRDRRFGDTVVLPAAISEVGNVVASSMPERFDSGCRDDLVAVDAVPVPVRVAGTLAAAFAGAGLNASTCTGPMTLDAGVVEVTGQESRRSGLQVDRLVLAGAAFNADRPSTAGGPVATVVDSDRLNRTISVDRCPEGCWLIVGEGHHPSWSARTAAGSLGAPQLIAGGFNGWWIPPHDGPLTVWVGWTAQRPLNAAIALSLAAAFVAITLAITDRSRPAPLPSVDRGVRPRWATLESDGIRRSVGAAIAWTALAGLFVEPEWAWWGLVGGAAIVATRRIRLAGLFAVAVLGRIAVDVVTTVRRDNPPPTPAFPLLFDDLHHLGLFAAVAVAVSALARRRA